MTALTNNSSLADITHILAGMIGLAPLFLVPGYLLNRITRVLTGREENVVDTVGASLVLSIGVCPIALYLLGKLSIWSTRVFFWACALGLLLVVWRKRATLRHALSERWIRICIGLALLWLVVSLFTQVDWQWKHRVYISSIMFDDSLRINLVGSIARAHSLPPPDPFLHLGTAIPLGYHYFWFLLCSLACREAPLWIGPRGAMLAGTIWTALTLWAALSLWLRRTQNEPQRAGVRWAVAALLLSISGLDLFVVGEQAIHRLAVGNPHWVPFPTLDWWSFDQITNWIDVLLWVPHCAAALVACATGLLILTNPAEQNRKRKIIRVLVAGTCFASAAGTSVYVAFGFAVFFAAYLIFLCVRRNWPEVGQIVSTGAIAIVLAASYLWETKASTSGEQFFYVAYRKPGDLLWRLTSLYSGRIRALLYLPEVALTLFLELGFFLVALFYWWRMRTPRTSFEHRFLLILLFLAPLFATSVLRSDAVGSNDVAMRGIFPAQFALAVMAGEWLLNGVRMPGVRPTLGAIVKQLPVPALLLLAAGLLTTGAEILLLRTFTMFQQFNKASYTFLEGPDIGLLTADTRAAYDWLVQHSNPDTVVQNNPSEYWDFLFGLYSNRQCVVNGSAQLLHRKTYLTRIRQAMQDLSAFFDEEATVPSDPSSICARWGVDYLLIKPQDPVWAKRNSWVWRTPPVYQNPMVRIYSCSGIAALSAGLPPPAREQTSLPQ